MPTRRSAGSAVPESRPNGPIWASCTRGTRGSERVVRGRGRRARTRCGESIAEDLLQQSVQVDAPDLVIVTVSRIFAPDMPDAFLRECGMECASAVDRVIFRA